MNSKVGAPLFQLSRSPAESLLSASMDEELEAGGFARQGFVTLDRFLRSLAQRRDVDYADLATEPSRFKDAGGTDFTCTVTIRIKFRGVPLIRLSGYGYGTSARDAKLIALAESLERLGFCLRGWHELHTASDRPPFARDIGRRGQHERCLLSQLSAQGAQGRLLRASRKRRLSRCLVFGPSLAGQPHLPRPSPVFLAAQVRVRGLGSQGALLAA